MHRLWKEIILPITEKIKPKHIVEIGANTGINTLNILEYCKENDAHLTSIDPLPDFDFGKLIEEYGEKFKFYKDLSLNVLPAIDDFDMILINGTPNWHTVYNELKSIEEKCNDFPIIFLHNTSWPFSREDLDNYSNDISKEYIQHFEKFGIQLNSEKQNENNDKKGVLTAIEDFIGESPLDLSFINIPAYHGLGIIYIKNQNIETIIENTIDYQNIIENLEMYYLNQIYSEIDPNINKLIQKLSEENDESKNIIKQLNLEKASLNNINIERNKTIQKLNQEKTTLQQNNTEKERQIQALNQEKTTLQQNNTEKNNTIERIIQEKEKLYQIAGQKEKSLHQLTTLTSEKDKKIQQLTEEKTKLYEVNDQKEKSVKHLTNENTTLNNLNIEKANLIMELRNKNSSLNSINMEKNNTIQELTEKNTTLQQNNAEKDKLIEQLNQEKSSLNDITAEKNSVIQKLTAEKAELYRINDEKDSIIDELSSQNETLSNRAKTLTKSKKDLFDTYKEQLIQLKKTKKEKKELEQKIEKNNVKLSELEVREKQQEKELVLLKQTLETNQNKINEFESSTSWKITKPLRKITNKLRGAKNRLPKGTDNKEE